MSVMKMGNSVPRAGLEPSSLSLQASVLPLHHVCSPMSPLTSPIISYYLLIIVHCSLKKKTKRPNGNLQPDSRSNSQMTLEVGSKPLPVIMENNVIKATYS